MCVLVQQDGQYVRAIPVVRDGRVISCTHEMTSDVSKAIEFGTYEVARAYAKLYGLASCRPVPKEQAVAA